MPSSPQNPTLADRLLTGEHEAVALVLYEECTRLMHLELRRRRAGWRPCFLGFDGNRWTPETEHELVAELMCDVLEKLPVLRQSAQEGTFGVPYLVKMIRHFLEDRRRDLDPVSTAGFRKLRDSIQKQIDHGVLRQEQPDQRIGKRCRLEIPAVAIGRVAESVDIRIALRSYPDVARLHQQFAGRGCRETQELESLWPYLASCRIRSFVLGDLLAALLPDQTRLSELPDDEAAPQETDQTDVSGQALQAIDSANLTAGKQALLREMVIRAAAITEAGENPNWSEIARAMGLDRRRVQEHRELLRQTLGQVDANFFSNDSGQPS